MVLELTSLKPFSTYLCDHRPRGCPWRAVDWQRVPTHTLTQAPGTRCACVDGGISFSQTLPFPSSHIQHSFPTQPASQPASHSVRELTVPQHPPPRLGKVSTRKEHLSGPGSCAPEHGQVHVWAPVPLPLLPKPARGAPQRCRARARPLTVTRAKGPTEALHWPRNL